MQPLHYCVIVHTMCKGQNLCLLFPPVDAEHTDRIQNKFGQLLESGKYSDVTFIVDSEDGMVKIAAHRAILASQSEYFDRLLYGEMKEAHPGAEIPLSNISLEAFQILLRYIYSGRMRITTPNLQVCHRNLSSYSSSSKVQEC